MKLLAYPDQNAWINALVEEWKRLGSQAIDQRGEFNFALSGGSTPAVLYKARTVPIQ